MKITKIMHIVIMLSLLFFPGCGPSVKRIVVSPENVSGSRGETFNFTAAVVGNKELPQKVIWTVSGGVAETTISPDGILKISRTETAVKLEIYATSIIHSKTKGKANVIVKNNILIGQAGPAGGTVFYDKGHYSDGWRYLEAAPVSSEFKSEWGLDGTPCFDISEDIGSGKSNTTSIINQLASNREKRKAAQLCSKLNINDYNDWFLPSKDELNELYKYNINVGRVGGFSSDWYWTSSGFSDNDYLWNWNNRTWVQYFGNGNQEYHFTRNSELNVRAVRSF